MPPKPEVHPIAAAQTLPLRSAVLRPGRPLESAIFVGDEIPETYHFGAFLHGEIVGVVSLFASPPPFPCQNEELWQLRGMAVEPSLQKKGIGKELVRACIAFAEDRLLWCNARSSAVSFYVGNGFETRGEEFDIPDVGPHFVMVYKPTAK
jgi:GNAT superfamily N-acetyltransferase